MASHMTEQISRHIVVFGFGAQGSAQAQNLADSGRKVSVYLRPTSSRLHELRKIGIPDIADLKEAASSAQVAAILLPDSEQPSFWRQSLEPNLPKGAAVVFAHGFNIHYKQITLRPDLDIILVAPMAQGGAVRNDFIAGKGIPCQIAVAQDATGHAREIALDYAHGIGRDGPFIDTTFTEETETDLFAEQAVLCGGLFQLIRAGFDTLVEAGYNPDIAYFCCLKEIRALAKLLYKKGIAGARERISDTALFGEVTRGPRIIDHHVHEEMKKILSEIKSGQFKDELLAERKNGNPHLRSVLERDKEHLIEKIHRKYSRENR
jgi:ketol-acid reductoisomerase